MRLVPNWHNAHRWLSTRAMALATALLITWPMVPSDLRATAPEWLQRGALCLILLGGLAGRLVIQEDKDADPKP